MLRATPLPAALATRPAQAPARAAPARTLVARRAPLRSQLRVRASSEEPLGEPPATGKPLNPLLDRENPDLVERFAVVGSGAAECKSCQYVYEPKEGDPAYPVSKGTRYSDLPADWRCPVCGAEKALFVSRSKVVAGFSQNQGYGLGANTMTGEAKSLLIYGTLAVFFALFLGGYLLD